MPTQEFNVTLPSEIAEAVKAKVAAGEYATESDVVCDGLLTLFAKDGVTDTWLVDRVASTYDAIKADPTRAVSIEAVRARLAVEYAKTKK